MTDTPTDSPAESNTDLMIAVSVLAVFSVGSTVYIVYTKCKRIRSNNDRHSQQAYHITDGGVVNVGCTYHNTIVAEAENVPSQQESNIYERPEAGEDENEGNSTYQELF